MALTFNVLDATLHPRSVCIVDWERDPADLDHPYAPINERRESTDVWRLEEAERYDVDAIPQDTESRLMLGFSVDPGATFNRCAP